MRGVARSLGAAAAAFLLFVLLPGAFSAQAAQTDSLSTAVDPASLTSVTSGEIPGLRTRTSRTFLQPDGLHRAELSTVSLNYRDARGDWQPIDNALVPAIGGFENKANRYRLQLPADLGDTVKVTQDDFWLTFRLLGANGPAVVSGNQARYRSVLAGVSVTYRAEADSVKEEIELASAAAPVSFTFALETSLGLTARTRPDGSIEVVGQDGAVRFQLPAPFMVDAAGAYSQTVAVDLAQTPAGTLLKLTPDADWLASAERRFPVVIDPTVVVKPSIGSTGQCYIYSPGQGGISRCGAASPILGFDGSRISRLMFQFYELTNVIKSPDEVLDAELRLKLKQTTTQNSAPIDLHKMNQQFQGPTWGCSCNNSWTAGGDFASPASTANESVGATLGRVSWHPTQLVSDWISGAVANHGLLLKQRTETVVNELTFSGIGETDQSLHPLLLVTYRAKTGLRPLYTFEDEGLTDRTSLHVNVASGNLVLAQEALALAGTGLDLSLDLYYNSLGGGDSGLGPGFTLSSAQGIRLRYLTPDLIAFDAPSGYTVRFEKQPDGTYKSPSGMRATLVKDAPNSLYKLTWNETGERMDFHDEGAGALAGRLKTHADQNGNQISYAYNADGNATQITDTQGRITQFAYGTGSTSDVITSITDPAGRVHTFTYYTGAGRPFLLWYDNPAGNRIAFTWLYPYQLITEVADARGTTKLDYDLQTRRLTKITRVTDPLAGTGPTTNFTYLTNKTEVYDANGNLPTTYFWDQDGRVTEVKDALGNSVLGTYTQNSDLDDLTLASGIPGNKKFDNSWSTNGLNNLEQSKLPTGAFSAWTYDTTHKFYVKTATDPQNNTTTFDYTSNSDVNKVTDALGNFAEFDYNANGTPRWAKDFKRNVASGCAPDLVTECFEYFANGNLKKVTSPLGATSYTYDSANRVASVTDPKGQVTSYEYDGVDRLKKVTYQGGQTITYVYDGNGNVTSTVDNTGTTAYEYDALNRLTKETLPDLTEISYTYDNAGNMLTMTDPSGQTSFVYDSRNLLTRRSGPGGTVNFVYDIDHFRTETRYPGCVTLYFRYDDSKRLFETEGSNVCSQQTLTRFTYDYLQGGIDRALRQSVTDQDGNKTSYTYDPLNRLVQAKTTNSSGQTTKTYQYAYDLNSNRCAMRIVSADPPPGTFDCSVQPDGNTTKYTYNSADQLLTAGSTTFTYDLNGNETSASGIRSAETYNAKEQLTSITPQGQVAIAMTYRGQGQFGRLTRGSTSFLNGALGLHRETTGGATTSFNRDDDGLLVGMTIAGANYYFLYDGLGSVAAVTDGSGNVAARYSYEPFGKDTCISGCSLQNPYRFLGGLGVYLDSPTGLYKMGTRYYDPALGRFTQVDPVAGGSPNRYDYASQDPVNRFDVDGQLSQRCPPWVGGLHCTMFLNKQESQTLLETSAAIGGLVGRLIVGRLLPPGASLTPPVRRYLRRASRDLVNNSVREARRRARRGQCVRLDLYAWQAPRGVSGRIEMSWYRGAYCR